MTQTEIFDVVLKLAGVVGMPIVLTVLVFYIALLMVPSMFYESWAAEEGGKAEGAPPQSCETEHLKNAPDRAARPGAR
jgi:Na+-transporting methylmalonyl-CoA/oxaloacetate decarboxylase gamma subunit